MHASSQQSETLKLPSIHEKLSRDIPFRSETLIQRPHELGLKRPKRCGLHIVLRFQDTATGWNPKKWWSGYLVTFVVVVLVRFEIRIQTQFSWVFATKLYLLHYTKEKKKQNLYILFKIFVNNIFCIIFYDFMLIKYFTTFGLCYSTL